MTTGISYSRGVPSCGPLSLAVATERGGTIWCDTRTRSVPRSHHHSAGLSAAVFLVRAAHYVSNVDGSGGSIET